MKSTIPYVLMILCGAAYTLGDIAMKKWIMHPSVWPYLAGAFMYLVGINFLAFSYLYRNIAVATAVCVIINIVSLTVISWICFKEPVTVRQLAGIAVSMIAVLLLE